MLSYDSVLHPMGVSEKRRTAEGMSNNVRNSYSTSKPRHCSRQEYIVVVMLAETLPELRVALRVEDI